ncbi:MAG: autotransporter domain-containing protein [Xanthobacteraceae bacterium]|nr:autotransporter domain-containing protein [Xanthobacteraceae bacterium]
MRRLALALAVTVAAFWLPSPRTVLAACAPPAPVNNTTVVCDTDTLNQNAPNGYGTGVETGLTINVLSGVTVTGTDNGIFVDTNNTINNSGTIEGVGANASGIAASDINLVNNGTITGTADAVFTFGAGTSSIVNNGRIEGVDNGVNVGTATVVNNAGGTISGTGVLSVGVSIGDGTVTNFGAISGSIRGISALSGTITNFGTVTSTGTSVPVQDFAVSLTNGTLNNFGTIQSLASAAGFIPGGIALQTNGNLTVNNAGTIAANGASGTAIDLRGGAVANINNSGSITANGTNGVAINIAGGAFASINNSGTISATGTGGVGIVAGDAAAIANRGTIIGGTGVLLAPVGATLVNSGRIVGTEGVAIASFGGNALIFQPGSRVIGTIALGFSDTATVQTGRDISSLLTFCVCGGVSLNATGGAPFAINGTQIAVLDPTAYALADRSLTDFTGMLSSLITSRFNGTGAPPPAGAASAFAPSLNGIAAMAEPAFAGIAGLAYARDNGTSSIPSATFEDRYSGISAWSQGFVGGRRQQADGPTLPATSVAYGGALGLEKKVGRDLRVGVFAGAGQGKLKVDLDSQTIETDYVFAGVYGRIYQGAQFFDFVVTGGATSNDSRRLVAHNLAPGGLETATASYDGWFVSPEIAYGVHIPFAANSTITPAARLRYAVGHNAGYSETGSAQNLSVGARTFHNLEGRLEMALARFDEITARGWLKTTVTLGGLAMQRLGGQTVNTVLIGQSLLFSAPGDDTVGGAYMGWGLDYLTPHGFGLFVAAEGSAMTDHSIFGTARGGVRVYF